MINCIVGIISFILGFLVSRLLKKKIEIRYEVLDISEEEFNKIPKSDRTCILVKVSRQKYDEMTETEFQEFI
jgi:hypothetical protein